MSAGLRISALGAEVHIVCDDLDGFSRAAVEEAWRDARADAGESSAFNVDVVTRPGGGIRHLLASLSQRVTLAAIEAQRGRMWMLHAAGLALPDGRVVALVGPSGRGKTTAARVLGESFGYVSDETVAIDPHGRVHPYRKPLSLLEAGEHEKAQRSPSSLGLKDVPEAALRLAAIVLLDRRDDLEGAVVSDVDLGDALDELVAQSSHLVDMPTPLRTIAAHVGSVGGVRRVTYTDAAALAAVLPDLATDRGGGGSVPVARGECQTPAGGSGERPDDDHPRWFRVPVHDELDLANPGRLAVLQLDESGRGIMRVLAGVAPVILRAADAASLHDLTDAAVSVHGEPDGKDARALVAAVVAELAGAGLLEERAGRWRPRSDVAWTGEGDRFVVLSLEDPTLSPVALEGSAAVIWDCLGDGDADTATLVRRVAGRVGVTEEEVADDVAAFLARLRHSSLVERR